MVEPSCSVRCSSHVSHCVRSGFHIACIQAFNKVKFLLFCGASGDWVESHSRVDVTEFRFPPPSVVSLAGIHRFHPHNAPFQSKMRRLRSLRGDAHLRRWLTACQPVPVFLLPIMCFVGLVVSPICCPFGATQHLQTNTCRIGSLPCLPQST